MRTIKLTIAYDGAHYVGWQRQAAGVSIQGLLEEILARLEGRAVTVEGAGRTDAGVHALGQVARVRVSARHDPEVLFRALNATLPPDVRVTGVEEVPASFHPRFDARSKQYQYWIWEAPVLLPALRGWCWHVPRHLDAEVMDQAARDLEGCHNCAAFQSSRSDVKTTVRTVFRSRVWTMPGGAAAHAPALLSRLAPIGGRFVVFDVEADGFLRHMVRALAGTLVDIGDGRRPPDSIRELLDDGTRGQAGATAPAHGLVMVRVNY